MANIALIGFGYWGVNIARTVHNMHNCHLVSIFDIAPDKQEHARSEYNYIKIFHDLDSLILSNTFEIAIIATPVNTHAPIVQKCLENGIHVLCEKVLSEELSDIEELFQIAREKKLLLEIGFTFLYNNIVNRIKYEIHKNFIGNTIYATFKRTGLGPIRNDVDVISDLASHDLSMMLYWFGKPEWVLASGVSMRSNQFYDVAFLQIGFKDKKIISIHSSWITPIKQRMVEIVGEKGYIKFDDLSIDKLELLQFKEDYIEKNQQYSNFQHTQKSGDTVIPNIDFVPPLSNEIQRFIEKIKANDCSLWTYSFSKSISLIIKGARKSLSSNGSKVYLDT